MANVREGRWRAKLGTNLEWHGNKIRVVKRVPPSLKDTLGTHLRETLPTTDPGLAEVLKHDALKRLSAQIYEARSGTTGDPLVRNGMLWRDAIRQEDAELERRAAEPVRRLGNEPVWGERPWEEDENVAHALMIEAAERIEEGQGYVRARLFADVAQGRATPLSYYVDAWVNGGQYAPRTVNARRHAVKQLEEWCRAAQVTGTLEGVTSKLAARYVRERFAEPKVDPETANKSIGGLSAYWTWMLKQEHLDPEKHRNVWEGKRLPKRQPHRDPHERTKRPFTDTEVVTLLNGIKAQPLRDMCFIAALTGVRINEVANIRVGDIAADMIHVRGTKAKASRRDVPVHPDLKELVGRRMDGKEGPEYLFHELPEQKTDKRGRSAPATQAFTRARRNLGVDDRAPGIRQSRIDFHSWRRWFTRKAREALESGAKGFTPWTIAVVVGHSAEDEPLGLTMVHYAGDETPEAKRACVEAVRLPANVAGPAARRA